MATANKARSSTSEKQDVFQIGAWFDSVDVSNKQTFVGNVVKDETAPADIRAMFDSIDELQDSQDVLADGKTKGDVAKSQVLGVMYDAIERVLREIS